MYSPIIIAKRQAIAEELLGRKLIRRSPLEAQAVRQRLDDLLLEDGTLSRSLSEEEQRWIEDERTLCKLDFLYYATRYCFINNRRNELALFAPGRPQQVMISIWGDLEEAGAEIVIQALKARQLGISTLSELAVAHRVQFYAQTRAIVGSSDPEKSALMSKMMELAWTHMPWWLMPNRTKYKAGILIEFNAQKFNSVASIQHGTQFTGIGRGTTVTVGHLSELADFDKPEQLVDASLMKAIHPSPKVFLILESTAKGIGNWWHKTWNLSKEGYDTGLSRFFPVFLPWYTAEDGMYPDKTWLDTRRVHFEQWQPSEIALAHKERAEAYVRTNKVLMKHFGSKWEMPREKLFWWEMERAAHKAKGILSVFKQECPADDLECFQSGNISIFDGDTLEFVRERAKSPLGVFGFMGGEGEIPARMQPPKGEVDYSRPPIEVVANWSKSQGARRYLLMPLKYDAARFDPLGKLVVWELPQRGELYGVGVDTAEGVGADRSVIEVVRKGTLERNDAQVAEFASPYVNAVDLWPIILATASLYSTEREGLIRQALVAIECAGNGEMAQLELKKRGWVNFHQWVRYDSKRIDRAKSVKLGWYTNTWSRAMLIDNLVKYTRDGWIDLNSPWLIDEEMANFELNDVKQKIMAAQGCHDDRIFALGIALFCLQALETRGARPSIAERRATEGGAVLHPTYPGHPGERDLAWDSPLRSYTEFWMN